METESKLLQHEDNVGRLKLNTKTVDIQALQLHITVVRSIRTIYSDTELLGKMLMDSTQNLDTKNLVPRIHFHHSCTPMGNGEIFWEKWKWKWKNGNIYVIYDFFVPKFC